MLAAGALMMSLALVACSDGDDKSAATEGLLREFSYNMTVENDYYRVNEFLCTDNGDNTFEVKGNIIHFFSKTNAQYKNRTGSELIDMVDTGAVTPSSVKVYTLNKDVNFLVSSSNGKTYTYHMYEGLVYYAYFYF